MIKSMTGFGRCEVAENNRKFTVEMKSVNHRYLELQGKADEKDFPENGYHGADIIKLYMKNVNSLRQLSTKTFEDLISSLKCKYIVVSYNNTYDSKSSSSKNKITLSNIEQILTKKGQVTRFEKPYQFFNAGKTDLKDHKELIYIVEVGA